ncbi:hypothetical protein PI125_g21854 [Phytophthora idaei]|nr:hypothetical protein PI125_g21854 [Phytophthora idaei]
MSTISPFVFPVLHVTPDPVFNLLPQRVSFPADPGAVDYTSSLVHRVISEAICCFIERPVVVCPALHRAFVHQSPCQPVPVLQSPALGWPPSLYESQYHGAITHHMHSLEIIRLNLNKKPVKPYKPRHVARGTRIPQRRRCGPNKRGGSLTKSSSMTALPLPPDPGLPLEPPSKKPTHRIIVSSVLGFVRSGLSPLHGNLRGHIQSYLDGVMGY